MEKGKKKHKMCGSASPRQQYVCAWYQGVWKNSSTNWDAFWSLDIFRRKTASTIIDVISWLHLFCGLLPSNMISHLLRRLTTIPMTIDWNLRVSSIGGDDGLQLVCVSLHLAGFHRKLLLQSHVTNWEWKIQNFTRNEGLEYWNFQSTISQPHNLSKHRLNKHKTSNPNRITMMMKLFCSLLLASQSLVHGANEFGKLEQSLEMDAFRVDEESRV